MTCFYGDMTFIMVEYDFSQSYYMLAMCFCNCSLYYSVGQIFLCVMKHI